MLTFISFLLLQTISSMGWAQEPFHERQCVRADSVPFVLFEMSYQIEQTSQSDAYYIKDAQCFRIKIVESNQKLNRDFAPENTPLITQTSFLSSYKLYRFCHDSQQPEKLHNLQESLYQAGFLRRKLFLWNPSRAINILEPHLRMGLRKKGFRTNGSQIYSRFQRHTCADLKTDSNGRDSISHQETVVSDKALQKYKDLMIELATFHKILAEHTEIIDEYQEDPSEVSDEIDFNNSMQ